MTYTQRCTRCGQEWSGFFGLCNQCKIIDEQEKAMRLQRDFAEKESDRQWQSRAADRQRREQQEFVQAVYDASYEVSVTKGYMTQKQFKKFWSEQGDTLLGVAQGFANDETFSSQQTAQHQHQISFLGSIWSGIKTLVKWAIYVCIFISGLVLVVAAIG